MEKENKKCFNTEHEESDAICFCIKCNTYLCKKCEALHSKLFKFHETILLDKNNIEDIFTGFCKEEGHNSKELEFFCKTHNELCCAVCICKIKTKNAGKHGDCCICLVEEIKNEKKNKLKENITYLKELSNNLEEAINELKNIFEKASKDKEELKLNIQKIFTKLRNKNKINIFLNECINVENNIQEIKNIQENIKKFNNSKDLRIDFDAKKMISIIF